MRGTILTNCKTFAESLWLRLHAMWHKNWNKVCFALLLSSMFHDSPQCFALLCLRGWHGHPVVCSRVKPSYPRTFSLSQNIPDPQTQLLCWGLNKNKRRCGFSSFWAGQGVSRVKPNLLISARYWWCLATIMSQRATVVKIRSSLQRVTWDGGTVFQKKQEEKTVCLLNIVSGRCYCVKL